MMFWLALAAALAAFTVFGYALGLWHARHRFENRRGGMLPAPKTVVDRWNFPAAPKLYDQEADAPPHHQTGYQPRSSLGNPLIPDPTLLPALNAAARALDPHSRRVPDGDIRMGERRYESWLESLKDHPA